MKKVILGLMFVFLIPLISTHAMTASEEQQLIQTLLQQIASLQAQLQTLISQGATATTGGVMNVQQLPPEDGTLTGSGTSAPIFRAGDTVSVVLDHLNVRVAPYGSSLGSQLAGALGTVVSGPRRAGDNTNWWQVNYKNGISGWSIESGLTKSSVAASTGTCSIISFTANGSSYTNSPIGIFVSNPNSLVQTTLSYIANGCNRIELVQTTNGVSSASLQPDTGNANIIVNPFFVSWSNITGADSSTYTLKGYSSPNTSVPSDVKTIQLNKTSTANNLQNTAILASTPTIAVSSGTISPSSLQTLTATFNVVLKALNGTIQMPNSGGFSFKVYKDGAVINTTSTVSLNYNVPSYGVVTTVVPSNTFIVPENNQVTIPVTFVMQGTNSDGSLIPQGRYSVALSGVQPVSGSVTLAGPSWVTNSISFPANQTPSTVLGDVNGDGRINCDDALMVSQYSVGLITLSAEQKSRADVNGDGVINIIDAQQIARNNGLNCSTASSFDYSLSNDGNKTGLLPASGMPASFVGASLVRNVISGTPPDLTFVFSGLPNGVSIGGSSLTLPANAYLGAYNYSFTLYPYAPLGTYPISVTSSGIGAPTRTTTFNLTISQAQTTTTSSAPTVYLNNASDQKNSVTVTFGSPVNFIWGATNFTKCQMFKDGALFNDGVYNSYGVNVPSYSGTFYVPNQTKNATYTLTCTGAGGSQSGSVVVSISGQTTVPTPASIPVINDANTDPNYSQTSSIPLSSAEKTISYTYPSNPCGGLMTSYTAPGSVYVGNGPVYASASTACAPNTPNITTFRVYSCRNNAALQGQATFAFQCNSTTSSANMAEPNLASVQSGFNALLSAFQEYLNQR